MSHNSESVVDDEEEEDIDEICSEKESNLEASIWIQTCDNEPHLTNRPIINMNIQPSMGCLKMNNMAEGNRFNKPMIKCVL